MRLQIQQPRLKNVLVLLAAFIFTPFAWMVLFSGADVREVTLMERRLAEMRDRLHHAESLSREREGDVLNLRKQVKLLMGAQPLPNSSPAALRPRRPIPHSHTVPPRPPAARNYTLHPYASTHHNHTLPSHPTTTPPITPQAPRRPASLATSSQRVGGRAPFMPAVSNAPPMLPEAWYQRVIVRSDPTFIRMRQAAASQEQHPPPPHNASHPNSTGSVLLQLPQETRDMLANLSVGSADISPPGMFNYLPHLVGKPEGLQPAFKLSRGRMGVSVVLGIPTIKRQRESYLMKTLESLIDSLSEEEKDDALIIVFIAEPNDLEYVKSVASQVQSKFQPSLSSGLLEVVSPSHHFYPPLDNLRATFGDPVERVKWRTKQNLDFAFLMMYARSRGTYYVQLEDDVLTSHGYLNIMKTFAVNQQDSGWLILEFSYLGFIGKLFKSRDLPLVVEFFLMFHRDKPIDWLLDHLLYVKVCNPEKDPYHCKLSKQLVKPVFRPDLFVLGASGVCDTCHIAADRKHCQRSISELRRRFKPSLFQHIGTHSSLKGKVQKLKDKDFGRGPMHRAHINPNAEVSTTLKIYQHHSLDRAYLGETYFWALVPQAADMVEFRFNPPIFISKYLLRSGNPEHPGDRFFNTTVEVLPYDHVSRDADQALDNKNNVPHKLPHTSDGYVVIGHFNEDTGVAMGTVDEELGEIDSLRLHVQSESESWAILSEISITAKTKR